MKIVTWGYKLLDEADEADSADDLISILKFCGTYDAVVVKDDLLLIHKIRSCRPDVIVIAVTHNYWQARISALKAGADDALTLPVGREEMKARLDAIAMRRIRVEQGKVGFAYDSNLREVLYFDKSVKLTNAEGLVMKRLVEAGGASRSLRCSRRRNLSHPRSQRWVQ